MFYFYNLNITSSAIVLFYSTIPSTGELPGFSDLSTYGNLHPDPMFRSQFVLYKIRSIVSLKNQIFQPAASSLKRGQNSLFISEMKAITDIFLKHHSLLVRPP